MRMPKISFNINSAEFPDAHNTRYPTLLYELLLAQLFQELTSNICNIVIEGFHLPVAGINWRQHSYFYSGGPVHSFTLWLRVDRIVDNDRYYWNAGPHRDKKCALLKLAQYGGVASRTLGKDGNRATFFADCIDQRLHGLACRSGVFAVDQNHAAKLH